jgi:hypothetical protein
MKGQLHGKRQEMAQEAHGKAQAQKEAETYKMAASKDRTLDQGVGCRAHQLSLGPWTLPGRKR